MARVWYGNLTNRLEENRMFCDEIHVGTPLTEYSWSDRHPYEVVEVKDQKHVIVRGLDHKHIGNCSMDNNWELISNENNPRRALERRGKYWYWASTLTAEDIKDIDEDMNWRIRVSVAGFDIDKIREKGKQTVRNRANVSFGKADYYYDYEF